LKRGPEADVAPLLGPAVVARLLPQQPPLRMVDFVLVFEPAPTPTLVAGRHIPPDDPLLSAHFPGEPIWPGVLTIEGLGQSCLILMRLRALTLELSGLSAGDVPMALEAPGPLAVLGSVDVKLMAPVLPGSTLHYRVTLTHELSDSARFAVQAEVAGQVVARGGLATSRLR
jgi:3-hydroxyacyl-[acyl-carrier-protein] dehydratase